jgi:hypothetical protein
MSNAVALSPDDRRRGRVEDGPVAAGRSIDFGASQRRLRRNHRGAVTDRWSSLGRRPACKNCPEVRRRSAIAWVQHKSGHPSNSAGFFDGGSGAICSDPRAAPSRTVGAVGSALSDSLFMPGRVKIETPPTLLNYRRHVAGHNVQCNQSITPAQLRLDSGQCGNANESVA